MGTLLSMVRLRSFWRLAVLAAVLAPVCGVAALKWTAVQVEIAARPGDKTATGIYHFTNRGAAPVSLTSVQPSCNCTSVEFSHRVYAPGESGEIKAVMTLGDSVGRLEKTIVVSTDDPTAGPATLFFVANVPEPVVLSTRYLNWPLNGEVAEREATVSAGAGKSIASLELEQPAPDGLTVQVQPLEPAARYRVALHPGSCAKAIVWPVGFTVCFTDGTARRIMICAIVR